MIRSLLLAAGFLIVTIALLFLQPSPRDGLGSDETFAPLPVTRADATPSDPLIEAPVRSRTDLAVTEPVRHPNRETFVFNRSNSDSGSEDSGGLWGAINPRSTPEPTNVPTPGDDAVQNQIAMMTQNILRELGTQPTQTQPAPQTQAARLPAPTPTPVIEPVRTPVAAPAAPVQVNRALRTQIIDADTAGASDAELEAMLRKAVSNGEITAAAEYTTALGAVDYAALLSSLLPSRLSAPSVAVDKEFMYRVQPNDSLAGLSSLFYGDVKDYARILAANPETLNAASDVSPGMLLKIPGT